MSITVDTRAGSKDLIAPLVRAGVPVTAGILGAGDIEIIGRGVGRPVLVGVEYKKWGDICQCVRNGRFADQLRGMKQAFEVSWLLIEGRVRAGAKGVMEERTHSGWKEMHGRYSYQEVTAWLVTMSAKAGMLTWRTEGQAETVAWLKTLYLWWTHKDWEDHRADSAFYVPPFNGNTPLEEPSWTEKMALMLPGLGPERARAVAGTFQSPRDMANAPESVWRKIEGVGRKTAARLVEVMEGREKR